MTKAYWEVCQISKIEIFWQGFEYNSDLVKVNYISLILTLQHATKNYFDFSSVSVCNSKKLFFMVNNFVNLIKTLKLFEYWKKGYNISGINQNSHWWIKLVTEYDCHSYYIQIEHALNIILNRT